MTVQSPSTTTHSEIVSTSEDVSKIVRAAGDQRTSVCIVGGATSLDYGLLREIPGFRVVTTGLSRVLDYAARDMTITVEAGLPFQTLTEVLLEQNQWLPLDVPHPERATLGGIVACDWSGAFESGYGTIRDMVIGISAIDGRGIRFSAGGRVVKNVAGYDFCKLLTGSLGTLGIVTQLTLKVQPLPSTRLLCAVGIEHLDQAEMCLEQMVQTLQQPAVLEILSGTRWTNREWMPVEYRGAPHAIVIGLCGSLQDVEGQQRSISGHLDTVGLKSREIIGSLESSALRDLAGGSAGADGEMVLMISVRPSKVVDVLKAFENDGVLASSSRPSMQVHAASGCLFAVYDTSPADAGWLVHTVHPFVRQMNGWAHIVSGGPPDRTLASVWGPSPEAIRVMESVKRAFDPNGILNPGKFLYRSM